jgi:arabinose-5-phosphate isomerase
MSARTEWLDRARRVLEIEAEALQQLTARLDDNFLTAVDCLRDALERKGKIVVVGVGKSGHIGDKIAATLTSTGSTAVVLNSLNALHGDLGLVADGDVILALSYSGETIELLNLLPALARFDVKIIALTGQSDSSLGRAAAVVLDVSVPREACPLNLAPTSSTTAMLALGDALAMVLLEARGFRKEDFAKFHPGGSLGRTLLLRVGEIMRPAEQIPLLPPETPVLEVIQAMTRHRTGAAVLVNPDGTLAGIFTHGDFARHFPNHPDMATRPVADFMTRQPIVLEDNKLAAEVLAVMRSHRIDDLVIIDPSRRPIGLVDSQDLSRYKVL